MREPYSSGLRFASPASETGHCIALDVEFVTGAQRQKALRNFRNYDVRSDSGDVAEINVSGPNEMYHPEVCHTYRGEQVYG